MLKRRKVEKQNTKLKRLKRPELEEEEKPKAKLKRLRRPEQEEQATKKKKGGRLHRRNEEPEVHVPRLRRRLIPIEQIIHWSEDMTICYVCGKEIQQEYAYQIKKIKDEKTHKEKSVKIQFPVPPLKVGKTAQGVWLYRHRHDRSNKGCSPCSPCYINKFRPYLPHWMVSTGSKLFGLGDFEENDDE